MATESGPWQSHNGESSPQQTNTHENAPNTDDSKGVLTIRNFFGQMLKTATGPNGLPLIPRPMAAHDLDKKISKPGRHMADYGKAALFLDGAFFVATTTDEHGLTSARHELRIYHHDADHDEPDTYQITPLGLDPDADPDDRYMEGVEQIAARITSMADLIALGEIKRAFDDKAKNGWKGRMSDEEAAYAQIAVSSVVARPRRYTYHR
ncbi:MAG: hypothetical protein JWO07_827 [Candidatus Saccharibacteria bacterium]|nr:hypothetical protein [Candidatus Saccharibacteria bacterium]